MFVVMIIVSDILFFSNDIHGTEDIECIVNTSLDILKINSLNKLKSSFIHRRIICRVLKFHLLAKCQLSWASP